SPRRSPTSSCGAAAARDRAVVASLLRSPSFGRASAMVPSPRGDVTPADHADGWAKTSGPAGCGAAGRVIGPLPSAAVLAGEEVDEERGGEHQRAQPGVHGGAELHAEGVGIGEGLAQQAAPPLGDPADLLPALQHAEGPRAQEWTVQLGELAAGGIEHREAAG